MKVSFVSHFSQTPDEGVRNTARAAFEAMSKHCQVMNVDIGKPLAWRQIWSFRPDILHFILSPTVTGLVAAKAMALFYPEAKTIITACHPAGLHLSAWGSLFKPDLVLAQSPESQQKFLAGGMHAQLIPNGIDTAKYHPVSIPVKQSLRRKYKIKKDAFTILHVASVKKSRNLAILMHIARELPQSQVIIVGRRSEVRDEHLVNEILGSGCILWSEYFPNIEEIYALSDCYVFPTEDQLACIETPLSVLEAMSCGITVVSTRFGALKHMFNSGQGLIFVDSAGEILGAVNRIAKEAFPEVNTRALVEPYSWQYVSEKIMEIYMKIDRGKKLV
jgi:glycosyltransferase involved in cell wall biosynthesis